MILTHRIKRYYYMDGDILIDDSRWRGQPDFEGFRQIWFHFGKFERHGLEYMLIEGITESHNGCIAKKRG